MKQRITIEQWDELKSEQKNKLGKWWGNKIKNDISWFEALLEQDSGIKLLFSVGQMIEFLGDNIINIFFSIQCINYQIDRQLKSSDFKEREFCDALWEAVKEVLKK
jgi:hypothetical protein